MSENALEGTRRRGGHRGRRWMAIGPLAALVVVLMATQASAAGLWQERGDAGDTLATAQRPTGGGALTAIRGSIGGPGDADIYLICLDGGGTFSATTDGSGIEDTQLFLLNAQGRGVYANDDDDIPPSYSWSTLPAHDPLTPTAPGRYYLIVTGYDTDPVSSGGLIFPTYPYDMVFGPTGPGGGRPFTGFSTDTSSDSGPYTITLTGARFC